MPLSPIISVVGTYRSGSSALAGVLHHLGLDLGEHSWGNHYEEQEQSRRLRLWWDEPHLNEIANRQTRQEYLTQWKKLQSERTSQRIAVKHPLLALSCEDMMDAWGTETQIIWSQRDLNEAIKSLHATGWGWPKLESIQQMLSPPTRFLVYRLQAVRGRLWAQCSQAIRSRSSPKQPKVHCLLSTNCC